MKKKQYGFTLVEMMIVVVVILTLALLIGGLFGSCRGVSKVRGNAEDDARAYAHRIHPRWETVTVDCQGYDSDNDGYVRCTIGDGANITEAIECGTSLVFDYQRGCVPMRNVPSNTGN